MTLARIIGQIIILACAVGIFWLITLILAEDVPLPAWVPFDPQKDLWLGPLLKIFGTLLLAPPLATLMISIILLGYNPRGDNLYEASGPVVLELGHGARLGGAGICALMAGALIAALILQNEPLGIWFFVSPMLLACLYGVVLCFVVRATYDGDGISSIYYGLRWKHNDWQDLIGIEHASGAGDIVFRFRDQSQRVSVYYNGIDNLLQFAHVKLNEASLARSA